MNDPQNERKYEFSFKVKCKGTIDNNKYFYTERDEIKEELKKSLEELDGYYGDLEIEEL